MASGSFSMVIWAGHFRPQPTADVGIDAQAEVVLDGLPSGWLLGLQIKTGPSWLGEPAPNGDGWVFVAARLSRVQRTLITDPVLLESWVARFDLRFCASPVALWEAS
jgi:hypothetical protein